MNEELKNKLFHYWYIIVIVINLAVSIFLWQQYQNTKTELATSKANNEIKTTIDKINSILKNVEDREKNLYPQIDKNIAQLNNDINDLKKIKDYYEKNKPKKEDISNEINKLKLEEISKYYFNLGYPNSIITYPSK